jgi:GT2 family glycosyltransferase
MGEIGIVIITYNSEPEIGGCLDAAMATGAEVIVVDNASVDGTIAEVRKRNANMIANPVNRGFAAAANQAFALLNCPYVLLLNPDAVIQGSLLPLRKACDLPGAGGAGGKLLGRDGLPQRGFMVRRLPTPAALILEVLLLNRLWPGNPVNRRYRGLDWDISELTEVEQPAGAFLMLRREVWHQLGGFDEGFYPLWFEDVDLCRRMIDRGYHLYYVPDAVAKHTGAHSIERLPVELRRFYWYCSLLRYSAKHFRPVSRRALCLAVIAGAFLRLIGGPALESTRQSTAAFRKVVRLASRCLIYGWRDEAVVTGP